MGSRHQIQVCRAELPEKVPQIRDGPETEDDEGVSFLPPDQRNGIRGLWQPPYPLRTVPEPGTARGRHGQRQSIRPRIASLSRGTQGTRPSGPELNMDCPMPAS